MKVTEQICPQCGKRLDGGATWNEANKCPQCGADVVLYDEWALYRWGTDEKDIPKLRKAVELQNPVKFIGRTETGYWLVGPVELEK